MNPEPLLVDIQAAAHLVGVSPSVLRRWTSDGDLPFVRAGAGGKKMFSPSDLRRAVERRKEVNEQ